MVDGGWWLQQSSADRLRSLQSLLVFMEHAAEELAWLSDKEEIEVSRDWSSQNLQLQELEDYFEVIAVVIVIQSQTAISTQLYFRQMMNNKQ